MNFYPRSPCGERLTAAQSEAVTTLISIHALLAESDDKGRIRDTVNLIFLSTLSLRRATISYQYISPDFWDFYPRSPCGERQPSIQVRHPQKVFLSTLSLRRATKYVYVWYTILVNFYPRSPCGERLHYDNYNLHCTEISIHALLAESDADRSGG